MTAVPPRPGAPDTSCGCDADLVLPHPAHLPWPTSDAPTEPASDLERAPDAASRVAPDATAGDGLREVLIEDVDTALAASYHYSSYRWPQQQDCHRIADDLLAGAAFRDVLAAAARDAERVARVRELADELVDVAKDYRHAAPGSHDDGARNAHAAIAKRIRRALDGTP